MKYIKNRVYRLIRTANYGQKFTKDFNHYREGVQYSYPRESRVVKFHIWLLPKKIPCVNISVNYGKNVKKM